ncbi:MAG: COX15/CtaA family protein [Ahrensia sp.]|nr:COX15/CtaA family protein [Ahrensia sp.]
MVTTTEYFNPITTTKRATSEIKNRALVRGWLYFTALVLLCLVVVGGATRLTDSGLSITEWKPIHGMIPPLSAADWQEELEKYRQIPEYQLQNKGMSMSEFQFIYWWEWAHRFLARGLGLVFALPLAFFWATGRLEPRIKKPLLGLLALGGLQGFIGWWMVSSGLSERVDVSHYRLATHLCMAALILSGIIWVARSIAPHTPELKPTRYSAHAAGFVAVLVFLQIYLGALVAGLDAGWVYNEWPRMGEGFFPAVMWEPALGWHNIIENPAIVQFVHRTGAYILLSVALLHIVGAWVYAPRSTHAWRALLLFGLILSQAGVGIMTLVLEVPLNWALIHQAMAFLILAFAVAHWRGLVGPLGLQDGRAHTLQ